MSLILLSCNATKNVSISSIANELKEDTVNSATDKVIGKIEDELEGVVEGFELKESKKSAFRTKDELKLDTIYLDSIRNVFKQTNQVLIEEDKLSYVKFLKQEIEVDTVYLAHLFAKTDKKSTPISFTYNVNDGDELFYQIENVKSKKINSIEIREGETLRASTTDLKRNKTFKGKIEVSSDNVFGINFIKKGYFKSDFKLILKSVAAQEKYVLEKVIDSVPYTKIIVEEVTDTIYNLVEEKNLMLSPSLNILKSSDVSVPIKIELDSMSKLIGWGYWIGIGTDVINRYELLKSTDENSEPLLTFGKYELLKKSMNYEIPNSLEMDVSIRTILKANFKRGLNSNKSYSFYFFDVDAPMSYLADLNIVNNSKLNESPLMIKILAIYLRKSKHEVEKNLFAKKLFYKLYKGSKNVE